MSFPGADIIEKLKGVAISRRDRVLLYWMMGGNAALIVAMIGTIAAFGWFGKDAKSLTALADTLALVEFGLVVLFVAGTVGNRSVAARTMRPEPVQPPTAVATATVESPKPEKKK